MSEIIIKSLMQLFAIIAKGDTENKIGRKVVEAYLKNQLNAELVSEYLELFDQFVEVHHNISSKKEGEKKKTSVNSVKVLRICNQINSELTHKQKIVVIVRLLELISSDIDITQQEVEFINVVAEIFNVNIEEFNEIMNFSFGTYEFLETNPNFIIIDQKNNIQHYTKNKNENFEGKISFLRVKSAGVIILKLTGNEDLYLNGQIINNGSIYFFNPGASLRSSKITPIYHSDILGQFLNDNLSAKVNMEVRDITYKFANGKIGIHPITFKEEGGKLLGIMGGSGAGKTTLLNVLCGNYPTSSGEILINGNNIITEKEKIEGVIGYISQDDLLIEELTVFQNLFYNAKLCFDNLNQRQIIKKCLALLKDLGLYHIKDLKVGGPLNKNISGGQRKRLNIGLELIREPSVLFVDEPTSGLSSRDSENIMDLLKELSLKGKLIYVVIHQPSSDIFKMFDQLIIMDTGGYLIYKGNPVDSVLHFKQLINHVSSRESECPACGNVNPEQIFNIIESKVIDQYGNFTQSRRIPPTEWNKVYKNMYGEVLEDAFEKAPLPEILFKIPKRLRQIKIFTIRDVLSKITNRQYLMLNLFETPILGFILAYMVRFYNSDVTNQIGYIYRENENIPAYLFMAVVVALFIGMTVSAEEIIRDQKILKREQFLNLSRFSYLTSKILIMFFLSAIQMLGFVVVGNLILDISGMTIDYWLIMFTTACFANMVGLNISSTFNSVVTIYIVIPFLLIPQLLLSGVIVKFEKLNPTLSSNTMVPIAGEVMVSRWAFEALAVNQYKNNTYGKIFYNFEKDISKANFHKDYWIPKLLGKISTIERNLGLKNETEKAEVEKDILLLYNELQEFNLANPQGAFKNANQINFKEITSNKSILENLRAYLEKLKSDYIKFANKVTNKKDAVVSTKMATEADKMAFFEMKNDYFNEALEDLVKNKNSLSVIAEIDNQFIQRVDPIFQLPPPDGFLRAHFFAPYKRIFGNYVDTFWVNLIVIWFFTVLLFVTLYFDFFKWLMNISDRLKGKTE